MTGPNQAMTATIRKIDDGSVEVTVELGASDLQGYVAQAERRLAQSAHLNGFRQGKVPPEMIRQRIDPQTLRQEALQIAVESSLDAAVAEGTLDVVDQHDFKIHENTADKLCYTVTLTLYPPVTLGEYQGITVQKKTAEVTDHEVETVLADIVKSRTPADGKAPELTDDFAKSLGAFTSLENLKSVVRQGLATKKAEREVQRVRGELIDAVIAKSTVSVPSRMVEAELDALMEGFDHELHAQGMELGPYLAHLKKTQDDLRREWQPRAERRVKMALILHAIGKAEHISVSAAELQGALETRVQQYLAGRSGGGGANALDGIDLDRVRNGIATALLNNKVFEFLEKHAILTT